MILWVVLAGIGERFFDSSPVLQATVQSDYKALSNMPAQWDRRYYRIDDSHGQGILLLKRTGTRGVWIVVRPDNSIARLNIQQRATVAVQPLANVNYLPASAMAAPMRAMLIAQADQVLAGGLQAPDLAPYAPGRRGWWRAFLLLGACPTSLARALR